jgi:hypothetical protein
MSDISKLSRMHMLFIATALILSQFIILGCCDSELGATNDDNSFNNLNTILDTNSLTPATGSIASVGSLDKYGVESFGNGPMGLASDLQTSLTQTNDGSVLKSRNLAMLSYGSELLNLNEFSSLTGSDTLGNEFGTQSENTATLKNCIYPFALIQEDLTKISGDGTGIGDTYSKTLLLLPDAYSAADLAMFTSAFGDSSSFNIKMFKYTFDINGFFNEAGLYDLKAAGFNMNGTFDQALAAMDMSISTIQDLIRQQQAKNNYDYNQWDSNGGVSCNWAEVSVK